MATLRPASQMFLDFEAVLVYLTCRISEGAILSVWRNRAGVKVLWIILSLGVALRLWLLYCGHRLRQFVLEHLAGKMPRSAPATTLIAPCKGIDPGFEQNVKAVLDQNYPGPWQVIFVVESVRDPAYEVLTKMLSENPRSSASVHVAGLTKRCSQKIHNMLAGVALAHPRNEVFAFIDSDVRPAPDWLAFLTEPLKQPEFPVSTGYRWYVPVRGGWASATRAVWNALVSAAGDPRWRAYAWGGAFAITRRAFEELQISKVWSNSLSDDLSVSQAVHDAGKKVAFVTQCVTPSHEDCNWSSAFDFMRRQSLVARVYAPLLWFIGWLLCLGFLGPLVVVVVAGLYLLLSGRSDGYLMLGSAALLYGLDMLIGIQRRKTAKFILPKCDFSKTFWMGTFGQIWVVLVTLAALICSGLSRKMFWRGRLYTLFSPSRTLVEQQS